MIVASNRLPALRFALVLAIGVLGPSIASAGFVGDIVELRATAAHVPHIGACPDGARGAVVAWQENTTADAGVLRALHVLSDGSLDPSWSADVVVCSVEVARRGVGTVPDGAGGAYVWWLEGTRLYLSRVTSSGAVAAGWPPRGRLLGTMYQPNVPQAFADGRGGIYVGGFLPVDPFPTGPLTLAIHLGPDGASAGGWPDGPVGMGDPSLGAVAVEAAFAPASDGGLWVAWIDYSLDRTLPIGSGSYRFTRLLPSGAPAPGWSRAGVHVAGIVSALDQVGYDGMRLEAIADAGDGGCYMIRWDLQLPWPDYMYSARLERFAPGGERAPGWPVGGIPACGMTQADSPPEASPLLVRLASGEVLTGFPRWGVEGFEAFTVERRSADGTILSTVLDEWRIHRRELAVSPEGEIATAYAQPFGWHNVMVGDVAGVHGRYYPAVGSPVRFDEWQPGIWTVWYGDAVPVLTGDGAALLVWSQDLGRQGLFCMRLGDPNSTVGVPPGAVASAALLRLRFVPGEGIRAVARIEGAERLELSVHDVTGRAVAALRSEAAPARDLLLPGTADLPPGIYFARASDGRRELRSRVAVVR